MTREYQELASVPPFAAHPPVKTNREHLDEETDETKHEPYDNDERA